MKDAGDLTWKLAILALDFKFIFDSEFYEAIVVFSRHDRMRVI